jgi:hypothetical protein
MFLAVHSHCLAVLLYLLVHLLTRHLALVGGADMLCPRLLTRHLTVVRGAHMLSPRLLTRHLAVVRWTRLLARHLMLRTRMLAARLLLPCGPRRMLSLTVAALLLHLVGLSAPAPVGALRGGRGRNRQGGNAGGEKYPGHHKISFRTV